MTDSHEGQRGCRDPRQHEVRNDGHGHVSSNEVDLVPELQDTRDQRLNRQQNGDKQAQSTARHTGHTAPTSLSRLAFSAMILVTTPMQTSIATFTGKEGSPSRRSRKPAQNDGVQVCVRSK